MTVHGFTLSSAGRVAQSPAMVFPTSLVPEKRLPPDWPGNWRYWRVQLVGWGGLCAMLLTYETLFPKGQSNIAGDLVFLGYYAALGIGSTHLLRAWMRWRGATVGNWQRLLGPGLLGVIGAGVLLAGGVFALPLALPEARPAIWTEDVPAAFAGVLMFCGVVCVGWVLLYLGYQAVRAWQQALTAQAETQLALKDAELRALRGQLNPHFLFNALNVVRRLAATDPSRTRQAITQLAGLLRDTLNGSEEPAIKLAAELRQVDAYLQLEKLRFEERLEIVWSVPPEALNRPVPPFAVLTLVENAVKHGISNRIAGGRLEVGAVAEDGTTLVRVLNSGTLPDEPRTGRVGMQNLRERLRLLYGDTATLGLRAAGPEQVVAELRVPAAWPASGLTKAVSPSASVSTNP